MPYFVRLKKTAMAAVSNGTTTRMARCSPRTTTPNTFHDAWIGVGNDVKCAGCGSETCRNRRSWATPMVATVTITRGASNNRRITPRSTTQPTRPPTAVHAANATQYGTFQLMTMRPSNAAARPPISAAARLITRDDR
jgi:hypothetical protein